MQNNLSLRPVSSADEEFLLKIYAGAREEEVSQLPWDANQRDAFMKMQFAAQQQDYQRRFPDGDHQLILIDGQPAGRLYLARSAAEIRILDIALAPEHRNKGLGTRIIGELLDEASKSQRPVRVYVERFNPAMGLFERLGFSRAEDIGSHFLMEWRASL